MLTIDFFGLTTITGILKPNGSEDENAVNNNNNDKG